MIFGTISTSSGNWGFIVKAIQWTFSVTHQGLCFLIPGASYSPQKTVSLLAFVLPKAVLQRGMC